jgi:hypothetical protein
VVGRPLPESPQFWVSFPFNHVGAPLGISGLPIYAAFTISGSTVLNEKLGAAWIAPYAICADRRARIGPGDGQRGAGRAFRAQEHVCERHAETSRGGRAAGAHPDSAERRAQLASNKAAIALVPKPSPRRQASA